MARGDPARQFTVTAADGGGIPFVRAAVDDVPGRVVDAAGGEKCSEDVDENRTVESYRAAAARFHQSHESRSSAMYSAASFPCKDFFHTALPSPSISSRETRDSRAIASSRICTTSCAIDRRLDLARRLMRR